VGTEEREKKIKLKNDKMFKEKTETQQGRENTLRGGSGGVGQWQFHHQRRITNPYKSDPLQTRAERGVKIKGSQGA